MSSDNQETFDLSRAQLFDAPHRQPLVVTATHPLKEAVETLNIDPTAAALVVEFGGEALVFLTLHVIHHGVLQGVFNGEPWMISLCRVCNGGVCFSPLINDMPHHFAVHGLYNAMSLMADLESMTYWDHITGVGLHGPLQGYKLKTLSSLLHMNIAQALTAYPKGHLILSALSPEQLGIAQSDDIFRRAAQRETPAAYLKTMGKEDTRLPRLDMGLGVWTEHTRRYYPLLTLHAADNRIFDYLDGRRLVVYVDPLTQIPGAFYTDANQATWQGDTLHLNTGETLFKGVLCDSNFQAKPVERPFQLFHRWFGFSFSFPGCEIYTR